MWFHVNGRNVIALRFAGHRKIEMSGLVAPKFDRPIQTALRPISTSASSVVRPSDGQSGHVQLEIQAESERSLANARPVLKVESSSTFSRP